MWAIRNWAISKTIPTTTPKYDIDSQPTLGVQDAVEQRPLKYWNQP